MNDVQDKLAKISPGERAKLVKILAERRNIQSTAIAKRINQQEYPLSRAQERLAALDHITPSHAYNEARKFRLGGHLNKFAFKNALKTIIERHEVLRSNYKLTEEGFKQTIAQVPDIVLAENDLRNVAADKRLEMLARIEQSLSSKPFNLAHESLIRLNLVQLTEEEHVFIIVAHHIICDAWSFQVFILELKIIYESLISDQQPILPELAIQYADYASWHRKRLKSDRFNQMRTFWLEQLKNLPKVNLRGNHKEPVGEAFSGAREPIKLSQELTLDLRELARTHRTTLFTVILSGFSCMISHFSDSEDVIVGTDVAGRTHSELESLIGFFINHLPLRVHADKELLLGQYLSQVRDKAFAAYNCQEYPFDQMVSDLKIDRNLGQNAIFATRFVLQSNPIPEVNIGKIKLKAETIETRTSKDELFFNLFDENECISGFAEYRSDIFDQPTVRRMIDWFISWLQTAIEHPDITIKKLEAAAESKHISETRNDANDDRRHIA